MRKLTHTLPNGTTIRVYDNGGASLDRYTVVIDTSKRNAGGTVDMLGLSEGGRSFSQHCEGHEGRHLGKRVPFASLDADTRAHIERRLCHE